MDEARSGKDKIPTTASGVCHDLPADWLADSYEEILGLLSYWRERLQDDVTILGTNPKGT
jgi:hypothetical protein